MIIPIIFPMRCSTKKKVYGEIGSSLRATYSKWKSVEVQYTNLLCNGVFKLEMIIIEKISISLKLRANCVFMVF